VEDSEETDRHGDKDKATHCEKKVRPAVLNIKSLAVPAK
jgi:hypothetical protein